PWLHGPYPGHSYTVLPSEHDGGWARVSDCDRNYLCVEALAVERYLKRARGMQVIFRYEAVQSLVAQRRVGSHGSERGLCGSVDDGAGDASECDEWAH